MDPALIGSIFAGVTGLATVTFGYLLNRAKVASDHATEDISEVRDELEHLRTQFQAALRHIYELRAVMAANHLDVPLMPDELESRRTARNQQHKRGETA